jgi:hypothetical protein
VGLNFTNCLIACMEALILQMFQLDKRFASCFTLGKAQRWGTFPIRKALPGFFLCIFSSLTCLKKPVLSKRDLLRWKVPARLYWDPLTSERYQPACQKVKKSLLCFTSEKDLSTSCSPISTCSLGLPAGGTDLKS